MQISFHQSRWMRDFRSLKQFFHQALLNKAVLKVTQSCRLNQRADTRARKASVDELKEKDRNICRNRSYSGRRSTKTGIYVSCGTGVAEGKECSSLCI